MATRMWGCAHLAREMQKTRDMAQGNNRYIIVVGIDYSETGDLALQESFRLASQYPSAEVHAVNVVRVFGPIAQVEVGGETRNMSLSDASDKLQEHVQGRLEAFAARQAANNAGTFERAISHLRVEFPAEQIAQLAADLEADLIVVGTHGRRGLRRLLLGSVAEGVVRHAPCPVFVVRPKGVPDEVPVPTIEPPCPRCLETRAQSNGKELWCEQHREKHGRRHTYHYVDRAARETNLPLVEPE